MRSAGRPRRTRLIRGASGVRNRTARERTRTTRTPWMTSDGGDAGLSRAVTTVTSWPREASLAERVITWLSTPPRCGENQGETWAICIDGPSEDAAPRSDVPSDARPGADEGFLPDNRAGVDRRIDPDRRLVESQVRDLRACTEVAALAEDAFPDVVLVRDVRRRHDNRVLHLAGVPHLRARPEGCRGPDVAVRADVRPRTDDRRALDVGSTPDRCAFLDADLSDEARPRFDGPLDGPLERPEQGCIRAEEVPRATDVDPVAGEAKSMDVLGGDHRANRVRDLELPAGGSRRAVDEREDVGPEDVDPFVDHVRLRRAGFLLQADDASVIEIHDPEGSRIRHLGECDHGPAHLRVVGDHRLQRAAGHHDVPVHAEERAVHVGPEGADRVRGPQPLLLLL